MANEFIARNGLIAKAASVISGSLTVTNGNIDGNFVGTINGGTVLSGTGTNNYLAIWSGTNSLQASSIYITGGNVGINESAPSYNLHVGGTFRASGNSSIGGNLTVDGTITAQEFKTEYVTQTVIFESGSTAFGNSADDTHIFSGSLDLDGDATVTGNVTATAFIGDGSQLTGVTASAAAGGSNGQVQFNSSGALAGASSLFYDSTNSRVGIGTTTPTLPLHIDAASGGFLASTISGANGVYLSNSSGNLMATVGGLVAFTVGKTGLHNFTSTSSMALSVSTQYTGTVTDYSNVLYLVNNTAGAASSILLGANPAGSIASGGGIVKLNAVDDGGDYTARQGKFSISVRDDNTWSEVMTLDKTGALTATSFVGDGSQLTNLPSGVSPAGSDGNLQYKSGAGLAATSTLTYDTVNGRLGVGTATPGYKLDVTGTGRITNTLTVDADILTRQKLGISNGRLFELIGSSTALDIKDSSAGASRIYINSGGLVGVGTTSPNAKLHVSGGWVMIQPQYSSSGAGSRALIINNPNDADFPVEGLTAYNTVTGFNIFNKEAFNFYARPTYTNISTYTNAGPYTVADSRFVNLDSTTSSPLHTWTFYQWDGAGDAVTDFKVPTTVWQASYWDGTSTRALLKLDGAGKLYVLDGATPGTTPVQVATRTWVSTQLAGYTVVESDTLNTVTGRGNTTTNAITVGGLTVDTNTLHVDATNNRVGIGTTTPTARLQVAGDIYGTGHIRIEDAGDRLEFVNSNVHITRSGNEMYLAAYNGWRFYDMQNSATRMLLTSAGDLGIGTTTPAAKLDVAGAIKLSGQVANIVNDGITYLNDGYMYISSGGSGVKLISSVSSVYINNDATLSLNTNSLTRLHITYDGKIGIGTTTPGGQLDIQTDSPNNVLARIWNKNTSGTGSSSLRIANSSNNNDGARLEFTDSNSYVATISGDRNQGLVFRTAGGTGNSPILIDEAMRITPTGNVGIGLTNPATKLQVYGAIRGYGLGHYFGNYLTSHSNAVIGAFANSATDIPVVAKGTTSQSADLMRWVDVNNTVLGAVNWGGAFGIGTGSPTEMLHVYGTALFDYFGSGTLRIKGSTLEFYDAINILRPLNPATGELSIGYGSVTWQTVNVLSDVFRYNGSDVATQAWVQAQGYGSGSATGTGTTNYITKWTGTSTLGSSVIYDNGTKVGIGTTSPAYKLTVQSSDSVNSVFRDANGNALAIRVSSGKVDLLSTYLSSATDMDLSFTPTTNGGAQTEAMRIKATGNVGIGTTSPSERLHVEGNGKFNGGVYVAGTGAFLWNVSNGALRFGTNATERARFDAAGNFGIGTTSPTQNLDVVGNIALSEYIYHRDDATQYLQFTASNARLQAPRLDFSLGVDSAPQGGDIQFASKAGLDFIVSYTRTGTAVWKQKFVGQTMEWQNNVGNTVFYANNSGNVGIGTTSPGAILHVNGSFRVDGTAYSYASTNASYYNSGGNATFHQFESYWNTDAASSIATLRFDVGTWRLWSAGTGAAVVTVKSTGNVGIGTTSPTQKLDITDGDFVVRDAADVNKVTLTRFGGIELRGNGTGYRTVGTPNTDALSLATNNTSRVYITSGGNVLIGTTSDAGYKLRVNGNSYQDGAATFASTLYVGSTLTAAGNANVTGNLTVGGTVTAQEFRTEYITQTVIFESGSTIFGNTYDDTHIYTGSLSIAGSGSTVFDIQGSQGQLFSVTDSLTGTLMSVNDISGLPILEVFDNDKVVMGAYNQNTLVVTGSNVGIGTDAPTKQVHVSGSGQIELYVNSSGGASSYSRVGVYNEDDGAGHAGAYAYLQSNGWGEAKLQIASNYIQQAGGKLIISSAGQVVQFSTGNVGIGTGSPSQKLHVVGNAQIEGYVNLESSTATPFRIQSTDVISRPGSSTKIELLNAANSYWQTLGIFTNGAERVTVTSNGNVGIGTLSPAEKLDVAGAIKLSGQVANVVTSGIAHHTNGYMYFTGGTGGAAMGNDSYSSAIYAVDNGSLELYAGSTNRLHITSGGNVGIGTTNPEAKLHVVSGAGTAGFLSRGASGDTWFPYTNGQNYVRGVTNFDNAAVYFTGGNVGIGTTSPASRLHVNTGTGTGTANTVIIDRAGSSDYSGISFATAGTVDWSIGHNSAGNFEVFEDGADATTRLTVQTGGNVGIGTTSPSFKLHVVDSANEAVAKFSGLNDTTIVIGGSDVGSGEKYITYQNVTTGTDAWMVGMDDDEQFKFAYGAQLEITDAKTKMTILQSGNVGIGTTTPSTTLHVVGTTTSNGNIVPSDPSAHDLGQPDLRWRTVFCDILDSAGVHESNLASDNIEDLATGTVLVWKNGKNVPSTVEGDHMRMGVAVNGISSPLVQGAEPVLCTGTINEGDYLITSDVAGHAKGISRAEMLERNLYDCVLGKALESGSGQSYLLKTWITI